MYLESDHFLLFPILLMIDWPSSASLIWWYNTPLTAFSASNLSLNISRCQTDPARTGLPSWNLYSSIWARLCWGNKHHQNLSGLTQERLLLIQSFYLKVTTSPLLPFCWLSKAHGHTQLQSNPILKSEGDRQEIHVRKHYGSRPSQVALVVKNPPSNTGDARDPGLMPGLGKSPGNPVHGQEPGSLQSMGSQSWTWLNDWLTDW